MRFFLLLLLTLYGCVSVPQKEVEEKLAAPLSLSHAEKLAHESGAFQAGDWPNENWWEVFSDPQLNRYIEVAFAKSPTLERADARVEVAKQLMKERRSLFFPRIDLDFDDNWQYLSKNGFFRSFAPVVPGNVNDIFATLDLAYDFDLFGRNRHLFYAALDFYRAQRAENAETRLFLSAAVAKTYFEIQADEERLQLTKKWEGRRRSLAHLHAMRERAGLDNEIILLDADKNLLTLEKLVVSVQEAMTLNVHLLRTLMGENPDQEEKPTILHFPFTEAIALPENLGADLLARRPDLMAQIWRVEAKAAEIGAARASFFPNINLLAFAGFEALHFNQLFSWASRTGSLNPALHLPIFTGGKLQANLRKQKAEFEEAVAHYHELLLRASREVVDQLALLRFLEEQLEIQRLTVENVKNHAELTFSRYSYGIANYMDALRIEEKLFEAEIDEVDLRLKKKQAWVNLVRALGGGYHQTPPLTPKKGAANG